MTTTTRRRLFAAALVFAGAMSACAGGDESSGTQRSAITPAGPPDTAFPAVGKLFISSLGTGGGTCSGSLIGDRVVLVSAHCLAGIAEGCVQKSRAMTASFEVTTAGDLTGADAEEIPVDDVAAFPGSYDPKGGACPTGSTGFLSCNSERPFARELYGLHIADDVALVHLERPPAKVAQRLRVITSITETRDLGYASHFLLDASTVFGLTSSVKPTLVGFDGRSQRSAALFAFGGIGLFRTIETDCAANTRRQFDPAFQLLSVGSQTEHGDSGGPLVVFGNDQTNGISQLPRGTT